MITKPSTFRNLIDYLGGVVAFAAATGLAENTVKGMRFRNSIAVEHWPLVLKVARTQGLILTTDDLVNMRLKAAA
jgi:hypothetical protein